MFRFRAWLIALSLVLAMGGLGGALTYRYLHTPIGGPRTAIVVVKRGDRLRKILETLASQQVLAQPAWLHAYARLRQQSAVRIGTYEMHADQTPLALLAMLQEGRVVLEQFTLAEGLNRWQVRGILAAAHWMTGPQFDALCDDPDFLQAHHIAGPTCEGYLFPDTYTMTRGLAPAAVFAALFDSYHHAFRTLMQSVGRGSMALSERQFVTLASIVEKETGSAAERPHIACVFYNRLQAKPPWRLETDPTVIYAATVADPHFNGNLTRAHLRTLDSPYNTYRVFGLPKGPIASPGLAALQATAQPSACKDFFFVSMNHGEHVFCPTLTCHNAAVQKYQVEYFRRAHPQPATPPAAVKR
jgi:UPF0755 protein